MDETLVGVGDIARQLRITRQAVSYLIDHDPNFPASVATINRDKQGRGIRVYRKRDVDEWIVEHYRRRR